MTAMRVLLLEYDAILCDLIKLTLKRNGYIPITCDDPIFAMDEIEEYQPEILIIDTCLPHLNAFDLLHEFQENGLLEGKYVVILSALGFSSVVKQAREAGADEFLVKPFDVETLVSKLATRQKSQTKKLLSSVSATTL